MLYGTVKYLGEVWINRVLGWYFAVAGVGSVWSVSSTGEHGGESLSVAEFGGIGAVPGRRNAVEEV